jgi:exosortase A-associated hydrolase 2
VRGHTVVVVPPFAEEMNRTRRMVTLQARQLAERGVRVVVFDLFGTGDSEGEFGDARWEGWVEDLATIAAWSRAGRADRVDVLAIRLGSLLAMEPGAAYGFDSAVLWQPCVNGGNYLRQFLRLRMAEKLVNDRAGTESVQTLLSRLMAGEPLEIAGYEVAAALAAAINIRSFDGARPPNLRSLRWFDIVASDDGAPAASTAAIVDRWRGLGLDVMCETVVGDPFWSLQEITIAPRLVEATTRAFVEQ